MRRTLFLIALGAVLTGICIPAAYIQRGYAAFGGEYLMLVLPMALDLLRQEVKAIFRPEPEEEAKENEL